MVTTDVLIIGGGVQGLLTARALRLAGRKVVLLDRSRPGLGASWAAAGMVTIPPPGADDDEARLNRFSAGLFPALAATLKGETGTDIEYVEDGWARLAWTADEAATLANEHRVALGLGDPSEFLEGRAIRLREPLLSEGVVAARFHPGGQVENRALVAAVERAEVHGGTRIAGFESAREIVRKSGGTLYVIAERDRYEAPTVVLAAGAWAGEIKGCLPVVPVTPQRGQILDFETNLFPTRRAFLHVSDRPYLVPRSGGRVIAGATQEFVGFDEGPPTTAGMTWILEGVRATVPSLESVALKSAWSGFRPMTPDRLPLIGPAAVRGLFYVTGHGRNGIGLAPGSAALVAAHILGQPLPITSTAFDPMRFGGA